ncbi:SubName: Full=Uncharacterized protein {ECO:0000313/EMBL:CCA69598.1} [Serendipita indica DSM 11827]|uniref:F-box domain-containing protein n=1 Tax=Serendipita indica (strain DSM 11827) TaxID=1109443 RepID=G4TE55_SERID|nr:SubName: Full=Uncharacterized protein {ECO:0000313/EMBL:CCA69598.1} [Serendipita indica DSM 11827]CCA69598.1 hypothetical protein PIIN_03537 [Serendipita indica DSM 11827]
MNSLPNELVSLILRDATCDEDSLQNTFNDPCVLATYRFTETDRSYAPMQTKVALSLVCKRLNVLIQPYLYEYVYAHSSCIGLLLDSLQKRNRARLVKRADVHLYDFVPDWENGWQNVLPLCKNIRILDIYERLGYPPSDWATQICFTISKLSILTRIEWNGPNADIADMQQLCILCPTIQHLGMTLNALPETSDAHNDAFAIKFPSLRVLLLNWVQPVEVVEAVMYPPFSNWDTPQLEHLTYFIGGRAHYVLVRGLLENEWGRTITSLELPVLGKNATFWFDPTVLHKMPKLYTLILDVFKVILPPLGVSSLSIEHPTLAVLGWRLRIGSALHDITQIQAHRRHFSLTPGSPVYFPKLAHVKIVHPHPFDEYYARTLTPPLVAFWKELLEDKEWVPILDFEGTDLRGYFSGNTNLDEGEGWESIGLVTETSDSCQSLVKENHWKFR